MQVSIAALVMAPVFALAATADVSAQFGERISDKVCSGSEVGQFGQDTSCEAASSDANDKVNDLITQIINVFSVVVGIIAVIMIIIGGFRYITSGGDSGNVTNAKNTILYALIGLIIVALAQFIVKFVLARATTTIT